MSRANGRSDFKWNSVKYRNWAFMTTNSLELLEMSKTAFHFSVWFVFLLKMWMWIHWPITKSKFVLREWTKRKNTPIFWALLLLPLPQADFCLFYSRENLICRARSCEGFFQIKSFGLRIVTFWSYLHIKQKFTNPALQSLFFLFSSLFNGLG